MSDEWLRERFGVKTVCGNAFMRGQGSRDGVAKTLNEVIAYAKERDAKKARADELRAQARALMEEAAYLPVPPERIKEYAD